jgi:predicted GNAT family acetyltransferase
MKALSTTDASFFIHQVQPALEQDEATNLPVLVRCKLLAESSRTSENAWMGWTEDAQGVTSAAFFAPPDPLWLFCEPQPKEPSLRLLLNLLRDVPFKRVKGKAHVVETFTTLTRQLFNSSIQVIGRQNVWRLTRPAAAPFVAGYLRTASLADADQLVEWMESSREGTPASTSQKVQRQFVLEEINKGTFFVWEDGLMVAMAARTHVTAHGVALGELFTPQMLRNRGYATALLNNLCQQAFRDGLVFCSAVTDPGNVVAAHVLQKLGFTIVSEIVEIEVM